MNELVSYEAGRPPNTGIEQTNEGPRLMTPFAAHPDCYTHYGDFVYFARASTGTKQDDMSDPAPAPHAYQADEDRIRHIYKEFEAAFREGDLEGMLSPIYERAIFAWDQIEVIGREALKQAFVENLASVWKEADATHTINGVEFLSSDAAIAWGNYVVVLKDGSRQTGHIMNTFVMRDGEWLIASEQACSAGESVRLSVGES